MSTTWLITGCSTGLGRELAHAALERGFNVVVTARDAAKVQDIVDAHPGSALGLALDITDDTQIARAVQQAEARFGRIDVLVNNAGHGYRGAIEEGDLPAVRAMFETNFFGTVSMTRALLPAMRARREGTIVFVSSVAGRRANAGSGFYSASKYAVEGMADALRKELGPLGIRVIVVEPGGFQTDFSSRSLHQAEKFIADYEATAGKRRKSDDPEVNKRPGDPVKGAKAILRVVEAPDAPFRLVLGNIAHATMVKELEAQRQELDAWKDVSLSTDFTSAS